MIGVHVPAIKFSDSCNTNSALVAGQMISNSLALVTRIVSGGGSTWNRVVLVTLPCGVTTVTGPDVASGGTTGGDAEIKIVRCRIGEAGAGAVEEDAGRAGEVCAGERHRSTGEPHCTVNR